MQAGEFDKKLVFKSKTYTKNSIGESVVTLVTKKTLYGKVVWNNGRRFAEAEKDSIKNVITVLIRYTPTITTDYVVTMDNKNYEIVSYREVGRKQFMELQLTTLNNG